MHTPRVALEGSEVSTQVKDSPYADDEESRRWGPQEQPDREHDISRRVSHKSGARGSSDSSRDLFVIEPFCSSADGS